MAARPRREPAVPLPSLEEAEREHVRRALEACGGNVAAAARVLGIARNTLYARIRRHGLGTPGPAGDGTDRRQP